MEVINQLDHDLFLWLNNWGNESWDGFWLIVTSKWSSIPIYAILLFLIYKKYGVKGTLITLVAVALLITCTDQLANLFKHGFERRRPCGQEGIKELARFIAPRCGRYGFFSAHAASSMALAIFVGNMLRDRYKWIVVVLIFWAVLIGYSRIYLGVHYPGDVLVGFIVGGILGYIFRKLQQLALIKFNA
ncbi:MAG: phosphatase PAP2 family protein [Cytophagaceae bacterium]|nr:phosphatase PAP2 family protein [Cytophagaceae bacterium]|tara:strand:+ start:1827 stop:2390 length:564 start_codon:yes stop_codon:yes gene_type:complete